MIRHMRVSIALDCDEDTAGLLDVLDEQASTATSREARREATRDIAVALAGMLAGAPGAVVTHADVSEEPV